MGEFSRNTTRDSCIPRARGLCLKCGEIKWIYRTEKSCEECWLEAFGDLNFYVYCPGEGLSPRAEGSSSDGIRHLKDCYHCHHRKGWNKDHSPACGFPARVAVLNTPEGKWAMCPRNLSREGYGVELELCRMCGEHAWMEESLDGSGRAWVYCSLPRGVKISG